MPYRPVSRPEGLRSLYPEQRAGNDVGMKTVSGSPEKAKLRASAFIRSRQDDKDRAPAWGPGSRSFSDQRKNDANSFLTWGEQLATTSAGYEFMAPPPEATAASESSSSGPLTSDKEIL